MSLIQQDLGFSNRQMKILGEDMMRAVAGSRNIIEESVAKQIREKNHQQEDMYETRVCNFTTVNETSNTHENYDQHLVVCCDLNGLAEKMILARDTKNAK